MVEDTPADNCTDKKTFCVAIKRESSGKITPEAVLTRLRNIQDMTILDHGPLYHRIQATQAGIDQVRAQFGEHCHIEEQIFFRPVALPKPDPDHRQVNFRPRPDVFGKPRERRF